MTRLKYSDNRFFYVDNLNKLKDLFNIFNNKKDDEDIILNEYLICCKFDSKKVYKIIYFFYRYSNNYYKNIKYDYDEIIEISDFLCAGDNLLIWIYEKYGRYIENNENNVYYVTYMEYLRDKKNKINGEIIKVSLEHLNSNSINFLCKNVDDIINNYNIYLIQNVDIYFKRIEKPKQEQIILEIKKELTIKKKDYEENMKIYEENNKIYEEGIKIINDYEEGIKVINDYEKEKKVKKYIIEEIIKVKKYNKKPDIKIKNIEQNIKLIDEKKCEFFREEIFWDVLDKKKILKYIILNLN